MNRALVRAKLFSDWRVVMVPAPSKFGDRERKGPEKIPMAVNTLLDRYGGTYTYFDIVMFGDIAEKAMEETQKGDMVEAKGFMKTQTWTDKTTGKKRNKLSMTVKVFNKLDQTKEWDIGPNDMAPWESAEEA